jgi:hypothetical protein
MNRLTSGMAPLFALLLVAGCATDPTDDLRNGTARLDAAPSQLFIELGATKTVDVSAVDDQGNEISSAYEVTNVGSGITVVRDSTFLPVFINDSTLAVPPEAPIFRFIVTGTAYASTSFTVSNGVKEVVIPVQVVPQAGIAVTFSSTTPALGDTVTITAPAGTSFALTSTVTVAGATLQPLIVSQSETEIRFIPPPNINASLTISDVTSAAAPTLTFSPATTQILTTPLFDSLDVTFSTTTPSVGQTVTVTLPSPLIKFQPTTAINFPDQLASPANFVVSADSTTLTFEAPPNATGPGLVDSVVFPGNFALSLPTRPTITAANIGTTVAATFSTLTPAVNQTVTVTAPAGFSLDPAATIDFGGIPGEVLSQTGSAITFTPAPGTISPVNIAGVLLNSAPQFFLTMKTTDTLAASATVPAAAGTDAPGTAPTLTTPGAGGTSAFYDAPDFAAADFRYYKLVVGTAADYTITLDWTIGSDIDLFVCTSPVAPDFSNCDFAAASSDHPESSTFTLAAGTYILVANDFALDAIGTTIHFSVSR